MKTIKEEIASNLLFYRKRANLTQKELAERLGIKHNSVSAWENGANSIDVEILFKICEILDVSVNDMYGSYSRVTELTFTAIEIDFISKLRKIDERGKKAVCDTLDREYSYTETSHTESTENKRSSPPDFEQISKEAQKMKQIMNANIALKK